MSGNAMTRKAAAQLKLLERLLISYNDFHHASRIASYIIDKRLQIKVNCQRGNSRHQAKLLWEALNTAMVVAYCHPFSGNDRWSVNKIPDLPPRFLKGMTNRALEVHEVAMRDR